MDSYLIHYGVKGHSGKPGGGQWYKNGVLTEEGKRHYGIGVGDGVSKGIGVGLKTWRVKKFKENEDGTYTKEGAKRYDYDLNRYNEAKQKKAEAKAAYKNGTGTKGEYENSKIILKQQKKQLNKAYKQVKKDVRADKGKKLYESGKRITTNSIAENWKQFGVAFLGNAAANKLRQKGEYKKATALCVAGNAFLVGSYIRTKIMNKRISAYYSHSRPQSLKVPKASKTEENKG